MIDACATTGAAPELIIVYSSIYVELCSTNAIMCYIVAFYILIPHNYFVYIIYYNVYIRLTV